MLPECSGSEDRLVENVTCNEFYWTVGGNDSLKSHLDSILGLTSVNIEEDDLSLFIFVY